MTRRALVTGAGGFLGACVVERLAQAGWSVGAVARADRLPEALRVYRTVDHVRTDLTDKPLPGAPVDLIVHCAAAIPHRVVDDDKVHGDNIAMGETVLAAARATGAVLINMSSMSAFGPIDGGDVAEDTPAVPRDAYGKAKLETERRIATAAAEDARLRAVSLRLPGMVGARSYGNFMSGLAETLIAGERARVLNPDGWFNNIVYGYDLAEFIADRGLDLPVGHRVLTIAAETALPVREAARIVAETAGANLEAVDFEDAPRKPFLIRFEGIKALGYRPASVAASLERFVRDKRRVL